VPTTAEGHRPLLIEEWLPIRELGIESVRERQAASALPPLSFLHIWWARRPLAGAQGVQLAALLPPWDDTLLDSTEGLAEALRRVQSHRRDIKGDRRMSMTDEDWYRTWVLWLAGVWGDTVTAEQLKNEANARGIRLDSNPFAWKQAYKNKPTVEDLNVLHRLLVSRWGRLPRVLDPTAGGGSIPFTSQRYGLPTFANDLNPVAVGVLEASLHATAEYGPGLTEDLEKWGGILVDRLTTRLSPYFELETPNEKVIAYVWVNAVACPRTGGPVPLSPNWWLDKKGKGTAVEPVPVRTDEGSSSHIEYRVITDVASSDFDPDDGTVARGDAVSPWDGLVVDGDYIKQEARADRMWPELFAVACTRPKKTGRGSIRYYRAPTKIDLAAVEAAEKELARCENEEWAAGDIIPDEPIPAVMNDPRPRIYGMDHWRKFFSPRQLLVHGTFVEEWRRLLPELRDALPEGRAEAVAGLLAAGFANKSLNWNSKLSSWNVNRQGMRSVFDRHDFAFKWTFGEFEGAGQLWSWCLSQLLDAYGGIADLMHPDGDRGLLSERPGEHPIPGSVTVSAKSATDLDHLGDASVECVNIDPPYYDNVQYSELANYFYVWEKRTLGILNPDRFREELTDQDNEAVANPARFADAGRRKKDLASFDYQQKMQAIFAEAKRVLIDDGVLVVWFTHKAADAWDVLGTAMIDAGFTIETSWPINTESAISLHQAKVNSAASTIILVCRKRRADSDGVFFEEIEADVRRAAVDAVAEFSDTVGVTGVDLQLSTYGPTLSVISSHWPVLSDEAGEDGRARRLRPEEALAVAREEVNRLVKSRLVGHAAQFDDATDFWLLCWANFQAREFPYDEARKLGMSTLDVDDAVQAGLVKKKAGKVELVKPASRGRSLRSKMADNGRFPTLVDALHHLLNSYRDDGLASTRTWLADSGYGDERAFLDTLQASVNAIPRVRTKKGLSVLEAQELEDVVIALFGDKVELPAEIEELIEAQQTSLEV